MIICLVLFGGCSALIVERNPLSTLPRDEALAALRLRPESGIEGAFSAKPAFSIKPAGGARLARDSMEDFFFAGDVTPSDSDTLLIRKLGDSKLVFILMRRESLAHVFVATAERNDLRANGKSASFAFDRVWMAEGSEMKMWTRISLETQPDGNLKVLVEFRERQTALAVPLEHNSASWEFTLERFK